MVLQYHAFGCGKILKIVSATFFCLMHIEQPKHDVLESMCARMLSNALSWCERALRLMCPKIEHNSKECLYKKKGGEFRNSDLGSYLLQNLH